MCLDSKSSLGEWNENIIIKVVGNKNQNLLMLGARVKDLDIFGIVDLSCLQNIFQNSAILLKSTSNIYWKWFCAKKYSKWATRVNTLYFIVALRGWQHTHPPQRNKAWTRELISSGRFPFLSESMRWACVARPFLTVRFKDIHSSVHACL